MSEPEGRLYPVAADPRRLRRAGEGGPRADRAPGARAAASASIRFRAAASNSAKRCARRRCANLREETGLEADDLGFLDHVEPIVREGERVRAHYVIAAFVARWRGGEPRPGPELDDFAWVDADEVGALPHDAGTAARSWRGRSRWAAVAPR